MVNRAVVAQIEAVDLHPNADRLEVITVSWPPDNHVQLVVGKHYRPGDLGVWLEPGLVLPGWLAHDLWLVGKQRATADFNVRAIEIRGVMSPGLWAGQWYRNDSSKESRLRADELQRGGGRVVDGWIEWVRWNSSWAPGQQVWDQLLQKAPGGCQDVNCQYAGSWHAH